MEADVPPQRSVRCSDSLSVMRAEVSLAVAGLAIRTRSGSETGDGQCPSPGTGRGVKPAPKCRAHRMRTAPAGNPDARADVHKPRRTARGALNDGRTSPRVPVGNMRSVAETTERAVASRSLSAPPLGSRTGGEVGRARSPVDRFLARPIEAGFGSMRVCAACAPAGRAQPTVHRVRRRGRRTQRARGAPASGDRSRAAGSARPRRGAGLITARRWAPAPPAGRSAPGGLPAR